MAKNAKKKRYAVTQDGCRAEITGENGRYYVCGDVQFRKAAVTVETKQEEPGRDGTQTK